MYSYVIRMSLVCHPYVTLVCSYVTRMSLVCTHMSFVRHSYVVSPWTIKSFNCFIEFKFLIYSVSCCYFLTIPISLYSLRVYKVWLPRSQAFSAVKFGINSPRSFFGILTSLLLHSGILTASKNELCKHIPSFTYTPVITNTNIYII